MSNSRSYPFLLLFNQIPYFLNQVIEVIIDLSNLVNYLFHRFKSFFRGHQYNQSKIIDLLYHSWVFLILFQALQYLIHLHYYHCHSCDLFPFLNYLYFLLFLNVCLLYFQLHKFQNHNSTHLRYLGRFILDYYQNSSFV